MTNKKTVSLEDNMLFPENYEQYLKEAKSLEFLISNKGMEEFSSFMEDVLDMKKYEQGLEVWEEERKALSKDEVERDR
jgi:hypothetical protein